MNSLQSGQPMQRPVGMAAGVEVLGDGLVGPAVHAHAERHAGPAVGVQDRDEDDPVEGCGRGLDPGPGSARAGPSPVSSTEIRLTIPTMPSNSPPWTEAIAEVDLPRIVRPEPGADVAVAERAGEGRRSLPAWGARRRRPGSAAPGAAADGLDGTNADLVVQEEVDILQAARPKTGDDFGFEQIVGRDVREGFRRLAGGQQRGEGDVQENDTKACGQHGSGDLSNRVSGPAWRLVNPVDFDLASCEPDRDAHCLSLALHPSLRRWLRFRRSANSGGTRRSWR